MNASASSATGADSARTSNPATLGPATYENARLPLRSELPSTEPITRDDRDEQGRIGDVEEHAQRACRERDDEQVDVRQASERVGERHPTRAGAPGRCLRRSSRAAGGRGGRPTPRRAARAADSARARQRSGSPSAPGAGIEGQHRREWQGEHRDLIAEERDRCEHPSSA